MMMLIYFGGQVLINLCTDWLYEKYDYDIFINVDQFIAGVIAIGFIFGAYMTETFRGLFWLSKKVNWKRPAPSA